MRGLDNPYFAELSKLAGLSDLPVEADAFVEPMNPDLQPTPTQGDAETEAAKSAEELEAELQEKKDEIADKQAADHSEAEAVPASEEELSLLAEKVAAALPEFGALAKLVEWSHVDNVDEELQKKASAGLEEALSSEEAYQDILSKVAEDLFSIPENFEALYTPGGLDFVVEKLSQLTSDEELLKVAENHEGTFLKKVLDAANGYISNVKGFVDNTVNPPGKDQINAAQTNLENTGETFKQVAQSAPGSPEYMDLADNIKQQEQALYDLRNQRMQGNIGRGVGIGGLAGLAALGGAGLYHALKPNEEEQVASEEEKVLLSKEAGGKLETEHPNETGGMNSMSQRLVRDFMKIAGAAALIELTNSPTVDAKIRKEASDQFDAISNLGRKDMDEAFVKVASEVYTEPQLHEIVAGKHTEHLLGKVAGFLAINDMSTDELQKVAGASGVAAKGVAGALTDAAANITPNIEQAKDKAEGAGREYVGVIPGSGQEAGGTGAAGGGLVNNMAGYNVINSPAEYDVEQTAASLEEAVMLKQAALKAYNEADAYIKKYASPVAK